MNVQFFLDHRSSPSNAFLDEMGFKMNTLSEAEKEEFEERAGIMEYEGQLSKEEAEWRAFRIVLENRIKIAV